MKKVRKKMIPDKQLNTNIICLIISTILLGKFLYSSTLCRDDVIYGGAVVGSAKILMLSSLYRSSYYSYYVIASVTALIMAIINLKFYFSYKEQIENMAAYWIKIIALNITPYILCAMCIILI